MPTDWQVVTALLQSQEQLAKTRGGGSHCQKELHSCSMELQKAEAGLKQAQVKLSQARQEGNSCQRFLHWRDMDLQEARAALQQAQEQLLWLQKQAQLLSQQLKESAGAQASAFPCKATGTPGWGRVGSGAPPELTVQTEQPFHTRQHCAHDPQGPGMGIAVGGNPGVLTWFPQTFLPP